MIIDIIFGLLLLVLVRGYIDLKRTTSANLFLIGGVSERLDAIKHLQDKLKVQLHDPIIGETLRKDEWKPFTESDIEEHHNREYKIRGRWYSKVLFYERIYEDLKEEMEQ